LLDVEFAIGIEAVEESLHEFGNWTVLQAIGVVPVGRRASRSIDCLNEPLVMSRHAQGAFGPYNDRGRDGQGVEQAKLIQHRKVRSRVQSVRPSEPLSSGWAGRCSLHSRFYGQKGLILSIFFPLANILTPVRLRLGSLAQQKRLFRGKPIGGMRPAAPRA